MAARHSFPSDPELELGLSHLSPFSYLYSMSRRLKSEYILVRAWGFVLLCETAAHVVDIAKGAVQMTRSESAQPARHFENMWNHHDPLSDSDAVVVFVEDLVA